MVLLDCLRAHGMAWLSFALTAGGSYAQQQLSSFGTFTAFLRLDEPVGYASSFCYTCLLSAHVVFARNGVYTRLMSVKKRSRRGGLLVIVRRLLLG